MTTTEKPIESGPTGSVPTSPAPDFQRRDDLMYIADLSTLYHRKRERYYDKLDRFSKAVAVLGGSAAFAALFGPVGGAQVDDHRRFFQFIAAAIAATSAVSLVWGFSERARKHGELAKQFCEVGASVARAGNAFTEAELNNWDADLRSMESNEPATLRALVLICQNQLNASRRAAIHPIAWYKRWTADFVDWNVERESKQYLKG